MGADTVQSSKFLGLSSVSPGAAGRGLPGENFCFGSFPVILDIVREWMRGAQYSHDVSFEVLEHLQGLGQIAAGFALGKCKFLSLSKKPATTRRR